MSILKEADAISPDSDGGHFTGRNGEIRRTGFMGKKMDVVIVTGLSGAGKTNAADWFEDQGYYCVDNMPPALIKNFIDLTAYSDKAIEKAAFVVDE